MPHIQVKTSPPGVAIRHKLAVVVRALADAGINIEAIGAELSDDEAHLRVVVPHGDEVLDATLDSLWALGYFAEVRPAVEVEIANEPGALDAVLRTLRRRGFQIESVLQIVNSSTFSIGVDRVPDQELLEQLA
jgi:hypothetical protein